MFLLPQAPAGALCSRTCPLSVAAPGPSLFSRRRLKFRPNHHPSSPSRSPFSLTVVANAAPDGGPSPSFSGDESPLLVQLDQVPLEGVIQFEKPGPSQLKSWAHVAFLSGGDVLFLLLFSAIGRFSHGFPVLSVETLHTADPFIAGWFLSAYFLGGYGDDGRAENGLSNGIAAAAKSWALGIPLGIMIRAASSGHVPPLPFLLVTMGSTGVLLIGWRALLCLLLTKEEKKKSDVYRRGSPFELFELLTSLVRRW